MAGKRLRSAAQVVTGGLSQKWSAVIVVLALNTQFHLHSPIRFVSAPVPATPVVSVAPGPGTPVAVAAAQAAGGAATAISADWFKLAFWMLLFGFGAWFVVGCCAS